ncbi:MAG: metal ABC transporter permease, partial [Candidatus Methanomethylicaceae archaeon]
VSEDLAKVEGISVKKYNLVYLLLIATIVALGAKLVGGLMTAAIVAIPSASARNLSIIFLLIFLWFNTVFF